jgi:hypothetical protein
MGVVEMQSLVLQEENSSENESERTYARSETELFDEIYSTEHR